VHLVGVETVYRKLAREKQKTRDMTLEAWKSCSRQQENGS
jgi:hypothetical protein